MSNDRTGLIIIRAWIEEGSSEPLRAHIRITSDVSAGVERTLVLARPEEVCATVREWLSGMIGSAGPHDDWVVQGGGTGQED